MRVATIVEMFLADGGSITIFVLAVVKLVFEVLFTAALDRTLVIGIETYPHARLSANAAA